MPKMFQMEWLDIAIEDWSSPHVDHSKRSGLCHYFACRFDYNLYEMFEYALGDIGYLSPTCFHKRDWEVWGRPRVEFLKRMRAEVNKMGYHS